MSFLLANIMGTCLSAVNAMMILQVLKVIGIVALIVLLVVVVLALIVLFVPVRYQIKGDLDQMSVQGKVHWLLQLIKFGFSYENEKFDYALYLFGFRTKILDKDRRERRKTRKERRKAKKAAKKYKSRKKKYQRKHDKYKEEYLRNQEQPVTADAKPNIKKEWDSFDGEDTDTSEAVSGSKKAMATIKKVLHVLQTLQTYRPVQLVWPDLKKLLYRARPRRIKGEVAFGMKDPSTTGQIVGAISNLYFLYQYEQFLIQPDFEAEEAYIKGHIDARGYIQGIYIVIFSIRIMRKKQFRRFMDALKL